MKRWKRYRAWRRLFVALAVVAFAVPVAQARAMHDVASVQTTVAPPAPVVSAGERVPYLPPDDQEAIRHPGSVAIGGYSDSALGNASTRTVAQSPDTFSWADAGIGAGGVFVLTLIVSLGVILVRRSDTHTAQPAL